MAADGNKDEVGEQSNSIIETNPRVSVLEVLSLSITKLTDQKLDGSNYYLWKKIVTIALVSLDRDDHLTADPPTEAAAKRLWLRDDARLFMQLLNSMDSNVTSLVTHTSTVKELWSYLATLYSGQHDLSRVYDLSQAFFRADQKDRSLTDYFADFKKCYEELTHWDAVCRILHYLKGSPGRGLWYRNHGHTRVEGFSDADWAGSPSDRRSTTGYCVFVGDNLVSWKSKKQNVVARSSAESEYRAMSQTTSELVWLHHMLSELGFPTTNPMKLWCDNQAAIHIATNPVFHERTKHIEIDCHFIREKIQQKLISTEHIRTGDQLADVFTKSLNAGRLNAICDKLGMHNIYAPA